MAQKRITELQLISSLTDSINVPGDDGIQTYRFTIAQLRASFLLATDTATTTKTLVMTDGVVLADASGGAFTITLPPASTSLNKVFKIKKIDTTLNKITIDPNSSELIDGLSEVKLGTYLQCFEIVCNGTGWFIV
jgi:hypothetical protein